VEDFMRFLYMIIAVVVSTIFNLNLIAEERENGGENASIHSNFSSTIENSTVCTSLYRLLNNTWQYNGAEVYLCGYWYDLDKNIYGLFPSKEAADWGDLSNVIIADFTEKSEKTHTIKPDFAEAMVGKYVAIFATFISSQTTKYVGDFTQIQVIEERKSLKQENLPEIYPEILPLPLRTSLYSRPKEFSWSLFYVHNWLKSPSLLQILAQPERFHRHNYCKFISGFLKKSQNREFLLFLSYEDWEYGVYGNSVLLDCTDCDDSFLEQLDNLNGKIIGIRAKFFLKHSDFGDFRTHIPGRLFGFIDAPYQFSSEIRKFPSSRMFSQQRYATYQLLDNVDKQNDILEVSIEQLQANPENYNRRFISVKGYAQLNFEYSQLLSRREQVSENQRIFINGDSELFPFWKRANRQPFDLHNLSVKGIYYDSGHIIVKGPEDIKILD